MILQNHWPASRFVVALLRRILCCVSASLLLGCTSALHAQSVSNNEDRNYALDYRITIGKGDYADVALVVTQQRRNLRRLTLKLSGDQFRDVTADSGLQRRASEIEWTLPQNGGELRWRARLTRMRDDGSNDALRRANWALFRAEDVVPPIASATRVGAEAITTMHLSVPDGWSVETPYPGDEFTFTVEDNGRRFDHPDGWIVAGDIGVRYDTISNTTVAVAAPRDQDARRLDVMAFVNWHLPYVRSLLPDFPHRLLIAMAGDPFFRGGLSAPNSFFMHTARPMISGNGTSTLVHELMHVGINRTAQRGEDWIVEGLAEYYSAQLMFRAGTVTRRRYRSTMRSLREWSDDADSLHGAMSSGARTALAVTVFESLDNEIRERTNNARSLDDVVRVIAGRDDKLGLAELRATSRDVIGAAPRSLRTSALRGYGPASARTGSPNDRRE